MFTGINFDVTIPGRYYCEVTEQRGVYRSNSFMVYKIGKCAMEYNFNIVQRG